VDKHALMFCDAMRYVSPGEGRDDAMLDRQMLDAMWESGVTAAAEDLADALAYDLDYAHEHAEAAARQVATAAHLAYADVRELASEWVGGYNDGYADELR
jgi:hypothetical protein